VQAIFLEDLQERQAENADIPGRSPVNPWFPEKPKISVNISYLSVAICDKSLQ
jgi:hypothetical protein